MYLTNLFHIGALLATLTHGAPNTATVVENEPTSSTPTHHLPEPDPRFAHIELAHPYAQIQVPHPTEIAHLEALKTGNISKRGEKVYGVYECSKQNFRGQCTWIQIIHNEKKCYATKYWPNGSIGPDKGVKCVVFSAEKCNYRRPWQYALEWPGVPDCAENAFMRDQGMDLCPMSYTCDWGT